MNILVTLNSNYISPLRIMLWSLFFNNPGQKFRIYLLHSTLTNEETEGLSKFTAECGHELHVLHIGEDFFNDAPILMHYSKEMYYRLLAHKFLPEEVDKILYLDPDILVINSISELYNMDISETPFAAAYHKSIPVKEINRFRLNSYEMKEYFNSGVLLINVPLQRIRVSEKDIFEFVTKYKNRLILPDQDILNGLYGKEIKKIDEIKYNFDVRYYQLHKILSNGEFDMDYIMRNTLLLHFCGKKKPWHKHYNGRFHSLYKHYEALSSHTGILSEYT